MSIKRHKQAETIRSLIRDAVGSGAEPDDRDHTDLLRAGLTRAQADRVVELATLAVGSHDPERTRPQLNKVADALAERVVDDLLPAEDRSGDNETAATVYASSTGGGRNDYDEHTARRRGSLNVPPDVPWKQDL